MTIPATTRKAGPLLGNGSTTAFPFTFKVFAASDIKVTIANNLGTETVLVLNTDYTVTLNPNQETSPGGTVTYPISGTSLPSGSTLTIIGNLPYDQPLDLPSGGNFSPLALENELDRLTMQIQQLREQVGRALVVPVNSTATPTLPMPEASSLIAWNENANGLENYPIADLATALAFATFRYDTFTGNGVTTQYTLSVDPITLGNLDVAVGGVTQIPGVDYTLSSGVLAFTSAPPNGASILARFGEGIVSGPSMDSYDVRFQPAGTGAVQRTVEGKLRETVSVKDFGAVGDGVTNDTAAIAAAHATGHPVFYPYGTYKHVGVFPECEGGIIGEGWSPQDLSSASAQASRIVFYNCTNTALAAIKIKNSGARSANFRIENISLEASSWDATTGCLGYGIDVTQPVSMRNVNIFGFKKSNILIRNTGSIVTAPYESRFESVRSVYSGEHGAELIGYANTLVFINYQGKWNGAPSFGVQPSVAGNYDGFYCVASTAPTYIPEAVTIIGGDCSYNSRYGWNFEDLSYSFTTPGYAEYNLSTFEARCGNGVRNSFIVFQKLRPNPSTSASSFKNDIVTQTRFVANRIFIGGEPVHPPRIFDPITNTALPNVDPATDNWINAPRKQTPMARSDDFSDAVSFDSNVDPAGNNTDIANAAVLSLRGTGTWAVGLGSPSRYIKLEQNIVRLPDLHYQATSTGWTASSVARGIGTAAPTTGTWSRGDIVWNSQPSAGGTPGWMCVTAGTPGTWKAMANLDV